VQQQLGSRLRQRGGQLLPGFCTLLQQTSQQRQPGEGDRMCATAVHGIQHVWSRSILQQSNDWRCG
jgi:hypothetical protein